MIYRKHIALCIIFISGFGQVQAQDTLRVTPDQIDGLLQLIKNTPNDDNNLVILLNEYARLCFYDHQFINGLEAANRAKTIAESDISEKRREERTRREGQERTNERKRTKTGEKD